MKLQKLYAVIRTSDIAAAEDWYTRLLGRGPDNRPMATLVQWELPGGAGIGLASDELISRPGALFLIVEDPAAERSRLEAVGITVSGDIAGDYSTMVQVTDPDDNLITLASPPSPPYPPA